MNVRWFRWVAWGVNGALALGFGLWFAFVRAPSPEEVCDHIVATVTAEASDEGLGSAAQSDLLEQLSQRCIAHKRDKIQLRGRIVYAEYARCVVAQTTLADIERC